MVKPSPSHTLDNPGPGSGIEAYVNTPIRLFISDPGLLKYVAGSLKNLPFSQVGVVKVQQNFFQAVRQLFSELMNFDGLVLVQQPPQKKKDSSGRAYTEPAYQEFYGGVASMIRETRREGVDLLGRCIPITFAPQDYTMRGAILEELFQFGITGAFLLQVPALGMALEEQWAEGGRELHEYFNEFFLARDQKLQELKEYKSAEDLKQRRTKAEELMAQVEAYKSAGEFDKAIALCRQASEVLPTDPDPYLEGGRLLVKKKRYPPALQMFRDAEKVAAYLPAPNQEIGNLRVAQVKGYVEQKEALGQKPDPKVVEGYLSDAVESFKTAIDKAEAVRTVRGREQEEKRKDAVAQVAENILTLELPESLGQSNPFVQKLVNLAHETLVSKVKGDGEIPTKYLIHFGLGKIYEGEYTVAEDYLTQAAGQKELFGSACAKLNFMGTYLRTKGKLAEAVGVYQRLLDMGPPFPGVVLFNLAVAYASAAVEYKKKADPRAGREEANSLGTAAEAFYVDPALPTQENFYDNTVMAPALMRLHKVLNAALAESEKHPPRQHAEDYPQAAQCAEAAGELESLLAAGKTQEALRHLFGLTTKLKSFFLYFDKHGTPKALRFAAMIQPRLVSHPDPRMQLFSKVLAVLVKKGLPRAAGADTGEPLLDRVMDELNRARQSRAARELALALCTDPGLAQKEAYLDNETLVNLTRELAMKLGKVNLARFAGDMRSSEVTD